MIVSSYLRDLTGTLAASWSIGQDYYTRTYGGSVELVPMRIHIHDDFGITIAIEVAGGHAAGWASPSLS